MQGKVGKPIVRGRHVRAGVDHSSREAPGWYDDPKGVEVHQGYWDGEKWTGRTRVPFWRVRGAHRAAIAGIWFGGIGAVLTVIGWIIRGDLLVEGELASGMLIILGVVLGFVDVVLVFSSMVFGKRRNARLTPRARRWAAFFGLVAVSPAIYLIGLAGTAAGAGPVALALFHMQNRSIERV